MSEIPSDLKYTKSHEWVRDEGDGTVTIGVTAHAAELLGDLVFVELPEEGAEFDAGDECAVVESVKAASDVYSPVGGEVVATNELLANAPETINDDAYGDGWIFTLRLEAGMNLYGSDMDEGLTPLESGLSWTVAMADDRPFIGREALEAQKAAGNIAKFIGLVLEGRGVLRGHQKIYDGDREVGEITSGGFSPTLERSIAMARVAADAGESLEVDIRGKRLPLRVVKMPFARNGKAQIEL